MVSVKHDTKSRHRCTSYCFNSHFMHLTTPSAFTDTAFIFNINSLSLLTLSLVSSS